MERIAFETVTAPTDDVHNLIGELDRELAAHYLPEQRHGLTLDAIFQPKVQFFLARLDGTAVGCGGVAFFATFAEVKRMYVRDRARRQGVAQALLSRIEVVTLQTGRNILRLETGAEPIRRWHRRRSRQVSSSRRRSKSSHWALRCKSGQLARPIIR